MNTETHAIFFAFMSLNSDIQEPARKIAMACGKGNEMNGGGVNEWTIKQSGISAKYRCSYYFKTDSFLKRIVSCDEKLMLPDNQFVRAKMKCQRFKRLGHISKPNLNPKRKLLVSI